MIKDPNESSSPSHENASRIDRVLDQGLDETASIVQTFIRGKAADTGSSQQSNRRPDVDQEEESSEGDEKSPSRPDMTRDRWPQFGPLSRMRCGVPYHQLTVVEKLVILEFLIDELLSVDTIAAIFSRREAATASLPCPYGQAPTYRELQSLLNEDECAVCRQEGDLICCDGCTSSYHKSCLEIPHEGSLPEGQWLCPECALKDPATLGPLRGGCKSSLDWFTVEDLDTSLRLSAVEGLEPISTGQGSAQTDSGVPSILASAVCKDHQGAESSTRFLAIHGFVFRRKSSETEGPLVPLTTSQLQDDFSSLFGLGRCLRWPLLQVPFSAQKLFSNRTLPVMPPYFQSMDTYDPSF